jgi:hypothetical protein
MRDSNEYKIAQDPKAESGWQHRKDEEEVVRHPPEDLFNTIPILYRW